MDDRYDVVAVGQILQQQNKAAKYEGPSLYRQLSWASHDEWSLPCNHPVLPPQTTSHLQPCDQGIIRCFKRHYRQSLLQEYILAMERKEDFKPTVLDAMIYTQTAWEKVTALTIANCFRHAGFGYPASGNDVAPEEGEVDSRSVEDLARHVCQLVGVETSNCDGYADIDAEVATLGTLSDEDIVTQIQLDAIQQDVQEDEESDYDEPPAPPSEEAVSGAFQVLKRHFQCREPSKLKDLLALETSTIWLKKQTTLSDFFSTYLLIINIIDVNTLTELLWFIFSFLYNTSMYAY